MNSEQPEPNSETNRRPWTAPLVGGLLVFCGVCASVYCIVAITSTPESNSEVIYLEAPVGEPSPEVQLDDASLDPDQPIRTPTTRRRTVPREQTWQKQAPTTTRPNGYDGSGTTSQSDDEEDSDSGREDDEEDSDSSNDDSDSQDAVDEPVSDGGEDTQPVD